MLELGERASLLFETAVQVAENRFHADATWTLRISPMYRATC